MLGSASALQVPLHGQGQAPIIGSKGKDLVSSEALQSHLHGKNLVKRANELFEIAQLSVDEYNHPTRVIGSKGPYTSGSAV
jgi:aminopeptidase Y